MKALWRAGSLSALLVTAVLALSSGAQAGATDTGKVADVVTTFLSVQKDGSSVTLLAQGSAQPVTAAISDTTILGGECHDCGLMQKFKAGDAAKRCTMCGCGSPNVVCVAWKGLKANTWQEMLSELPHGAVLRATYNVAGKPESGLNSLLIDWHDVLVPVDGLAGQTPAQLQAIVKPVGGANAQLSTDGKQLQFTMKDNWGADKETKLEAELAKAGGKVVYPPLAVATK